MSGHYFDDDPSVADRPSTIEATIWGAHRSFVTSTGVFSGSRLDKATGVLLENSEPPPAGSRVLDLGCGWGPIACALAGAGLEVWAVDVNERALRLTRLNAQRFGLDIYTARPEEVPEDVRFDAIWSNPPIRIGKQALHEILLHWLPRLTPTGEARLVVGKNLGADSLQNWLKEQGFDAVRAASVKGFRVLVVSQRTQGPQEPSAP